MIGKTHQWSVILAVFLLGISLQNLSAGEMPRVTGKLKEVQAALEKFKDPIYAIRSGYLSTVGCIMMPKGSMGIHFVNLNLVGPPPDPMKPSILMYEPVGEKLELVAVEWLVPYIPGKSKRPMLFGRKFHGPMEGHEPILPKELHHFDFHVWLFKKNPKGIFSDANPNFKCSVKTNYTIQEKPPPMMKMK